MKSIIKSTWVLVAITLIAGLALASVYEITKEPIAEAEKKAREDAYRVVMPDATGFIAVGQLEESAYPVEMDNGITIDACLCATTTEPSESSSGTFNYEIVGYVVNVTSPNGYGGAINLAVGILRDGAISGISVISQSETPGLGAVCAEKKFTDQFKGIRDVVEYVKTGKTEPNQIDAISGATKTTSAVTEAVNAARAYVAEYTTAEGGNG